MKKLPIVLMLQAALLCANAAEVTSLPNAGTVRGRIVDADEGILPGATVYIKSLKTSVVSDENGFYNLTNI